MSKNLLLAASALTTVLLAGAASAHDITGTGLYAGVDNTTATSAAIKVAEELRFSTTNSTATAVAGTRGDLTYTVASSGGTYPSGQLVLTLDVSNAIFTENLAASSILTGGTTCTPTASLSSGGQTGESSVTLIVSGFETCGGSGTEIGIELPIQMTGQGDVVAGFSLRTLAGDLPVDGGRDEATFIELVDAISAEFSAVTTTAVASVADAFESFTTTTGAVAQLDLDIATGVYQTINLTATSTLTANIVGAEDIEDITITATPTSGSFTGFNLVVDGSAFGFTTTTTTSDRRAEIGAGTATVASTSYAITVVDLTATGTATTALTANAVIPATEFTLNARFDLTAADAITTSTGAFTDFNVTGSGEVDRDGTSFVAPWVALGSGTTNSVIRLSNNGVDATGPVQVRLLSTINGADATNELVTITNAQLQAGELNSEGGIEPGEAISISSAQLKAAFDVDAGNGDVEITIEAQPGNISGKVRNTSASQTFEISLNELE